METSTNLKRWRDGGETKAKKQVTQPNIPTESQQPAHEVTLQQPPTRSPQQAPQSSLEKSPQIPNRLHFNPPKNPLSLSLSHFPGCLPDLDPSVDSQITTTKPTFPVLQSLTKR